MKYCMETLRHNGIYVPAYEPKKLSVKIRGQIFSLSPRTEQMAVAWARKKQSATSPPDFVFYRNFIQDFLEALKAENPSDKHVEDSAADYAKLLANMPDNTPLDSGFDNPAEIDFSEVTERVRREQQKKESMPKEEKKKQANERKIQREKLREQYGYAYVDGKKLEVANWTAEPSCIFAGRGDHPKRGKWKEGPKQDDIVLNLSKDSPTPIGNWNGRVWEPEKMYVAKWVDKLSGKVKYGCFSDSAFLKQEMEREKFKKAEKLGSKIPDIESHIMANLSSENAERRKVATICWLVLRANMRVGDEKDPGEADTVGAITLRPEHISVQGNVISFDFLGKDAVRWVKQVEAPDVVAKNIREFSAQCKEYLFEGIDSKKVSRFLSERMEGLTAKVFRTWRCTKTVKEYLDKCPTKKEDFDFVKLFCAKMANLEAAKVANHKKKIPQNFDERLAEKEKRLKELRCLLEEKDKQGKKTDATLRRLEKSKLDVEIAKETKEYNLGTSLKSYIDPKAYVEWAARVGFPLEKFYPKTLRKKYSWALGCG